MCCRCPPSVGLYSSIYILLTVVVTFYFQHARSIYVADSSFVDLDGILDSYELMELNSKLELKRMENKVTFDGFRYNISFNIIVIDLDNDERVVQEGTELTGPDTGTLEMYINNKSFCKIMDNYIYYHIGESGQKPVSLCPVPAGFRQIYDNHPGFNDVAMPLLETPTRKTFLPELIRHGEKIACKQFQFINEQDNRLGQEHNI